MPRQVDPDLLAETADRAVQLKALTDHPAWTELRMALEERQERETKRLLRSMMRGYPISEEMQLRHAGFWEGVKAVLETPGAVEKKAQAMLETAERAQQEGAT